MIKRIYFIIFLVFFLLCHTYSQYLLVIEKSTGKPIADVNIFNENKTRSIITDYEGKADLSAFQKGIVFLQHISYFPSSVAYLGLDLQVELNEKIIVFDEVVVSFNKWTQKAETVPQKVLSLSKKRIDFQNPQTSADLLTSTGQVFVQKSQLGGGSPKLRGFSANSVLLVVDGVRMNNAIFRGGNLQNIINIDPNAIQRTEVIFGPGSVIYGSDALGGVMNFHTFEPSWNHEDKTQLTVNLMTRYSTAAKEKTGHFDISLAKRKITFFHSSSFTDLSHLRAGSKRNKQYEKEFERNFFVEHINHQDVLIQNSNINVQKFSGYNLFNSITKFKWRVTPKIDLTYGNYYSTTSDIPRYDRLVVPLNNHPDSLTFATWHYGPQVWHMNLLKVDFYHANPIFDQAKITLAHQQFSESRINRKFGDNSQKTQIERVDMWSLALDWDKEYENSNLYYGLDFFYNDILSKAFNYDIVTNETTQATTRYPSGGSQYTAIALYINYVAKFSPKIILNSGIRFNFIQLDGQSDNFIPLDLGTLVGNIHEINLKNKAANGAVGLIYKINAKHKIKYSISSGFRAPNLDDVGKIFELDDDDIIVPNHNLTSEYVINNGITYAYKYNNVSWSIIGFYSRLFNAIVKGRFHIDGKDQWNGLNIYAQMNAKKAFIYGGSSIFQIELSKNWATSFSCNYTNGKELTNHQPLRHTTPIFGRYALTFKKGRLKSQFYVEYNGSKRPNQIPNSEFISKLYLYTKNGSPEWYTLNLRASYQIGRLLNINIAVENILDTHYRPYSSGISAPGRNFTATLRASI